MNKIELLAPAKDLNKAKIAIMYGADAVYVGGKFYSLRSRASNFELEDLKELSQFAKKYGAKVYVTVNIVFHDADYYGIREYLRYLEEIGIDAIIISSLALIPVSLIALLLGMSLTADTILSYVIVNIGAFCLWEIGYTQFTTHDAVDEKKRITRAMNARIEFQ